MERQDFGNPRFYLATNNICKTWVLTFDVGLNGLETQSCINLKDSHLNVAVAWENDLFSCPKGWSLWWELLMHKALQWEQNIRNCKSPYKDKNKWVAERTLAPYWGQLPCFWTKQVDPSFLTPFQPRVRKELFQVAWRGRAILLEHYCVACSVLKA